MIKTKLAFLVGQLFPINQNSSNTFKIALIHWIKPALHKSHFCFDHVNRLIASRLKACYMIKTKVAFLESQLLSSQSEQSEKFSNSLDWLEKSRPSRKVTFVLIM